jgi:acetate kinase
MLLLVLNCGSATVKYKLFDCARRPPRLVTGGKVETSTQYSEAIARIVAGLPARPDAVAHRVVHGGSRFEAPVLLEPEVEAEIRRLVPLAPLHNAPALEGIDAARRLGVPMVAVFDTAFHAALPERAWRYALPATLPAEVRRYGFHGLSHQYLAERYTELTGSKQPAIVTLHLGSGCSAAAIRGGVCVDTSMGMTPLEGLVMGTRAGDLDPGAILYLLRAGTSLESIEQMLHHEAGLAGLAGTPDMRALLARSDAQARLAVEVFCYRIRKYVGAYLAALGGAEAVVFSGGIGENSPEIRRVVAEGLECFGLTLDAERNSAGPDAGRISTGGSRLHAWAIRTDEEVLIAHLAVGRLEGRT